MAPVGRFDSPRSHRRGILVLMAIVACVVMAAILLPGRLLTDKGVFDSAGDATTPAPNARETARVERLARLARGTTADLVFLGDSITAQWEEQGQEVWRRFYGDRRAINLGVGWEQTENVLWRIEQGHLDALQPRLIVLMIGTNNSEHGRHSPRQIRAGVEAIVDQLMARLPDAHTLVLGIFPRGHELDDPFRQNNEATNRLLAALAERDRVHFRDIGGVFLRDDGSLAPELFTDHLHLSPEGYARWAEAIDGDVQRLLGARR